jgi:hypothetical protein
MEAYSPVITLSKKVAPMRLQSFASSLIRTITIAASVSQTDHHNACHHRHSSLRAAAWTSRRRDTNKKMSQTHWNNKPTNKVLQQPNPHMSPSCCRASHHTELSTPLLPPAVHISKDDTQGGNDDVSPPSFDP